MARRYAGLMVLSLLLGLTTLAGAQQPEAGPRIDFSQPISATVPVANHNFGTDIAVGAAEDGWPLYISTASYQTVERFINPGGAGWIPSDCVLNDVSSANLLDSTNMATSGVGANALFVIGDPLYSHFVDPVNHVNQGRVRVFVSDGQGCLTEVGQVNPPTNAANQGFGASVDLELSGSTGLLVVGALSLATDTDKAHIYNVSGTTFTYDENLTRGDAANNTNFGSAVAVDGVAESTPRIAVTEGSPFGGSGGFFVFEPNGANWQEAYSEVLGPTTVIDVVVNGSETVVAVICNNTGCGSQNQVFYYRRVTSPELSYENESVITFGGGRIPQDVKLGLHETAARTTEVWAAVASGSNYGALFVRDSADDFPGFRIWSESDTFFTGAFLSSVALVADAPAPMGLYGDVQRLVGGESGAGVVWAASPSTRDFELIENGRFTVDLDTPASQSWKVIDGTGEKRTCDDLDPEDCNFKFKGSATEFSRLKQKVKIANYAFQNDDEFVLSFDALAKNPNTNLVAKLKIRLNNGKNIKLVRNVPVLATWTTLTTDLLSIGNKRPVRIVLIFTNRSPGGSAYIDNVSVIGSTPEVRAAGLPVPDALALPTP
jgi:hypothetical protein